MKTQNEATMSKSSMTLALQKVNWCGYTNSIYLDYDSGTAVGALAFEVEYAKQGRPDNGGG
ncbi:hypothetical protein ACLOJK_040632 [Asimina triloba]